MPTVEIGASSLVDFLKMLLGQSERSVEAEIGGDAPHEDEACQCPGCRLARFEMPVALEAGDKELDDAIVDEVKELIRTGEKSQECALEASKTLCLKPLPAKVERILMQYRVDRVAACVRAQDDLVALLPPNRKPPKSVQLMVMTVDRALEKLEQARTLIRERLVQKKAAAEAIAEVEKTVDEVAAAPAAEASNG